MARRFGWGAALAAGVLAAMPAWAAGDEGAEPREAVEADAGSASPEAVFEFLAAEIAAQRGDVDSAIAIFRRMAREHRDAAIARRAVELAIRTRSFNAALDSSALLLELEPESTLAREIIAALLGSENDIGKARETVARLLQFSGDRGPMLMQMAHLFAKFGDKSAVLEATRAIARPHAKLPEAHYAIGVAALIANDMTTALAESDAALQIRPAWDPGAILKAQVLRKSAPASVVPFYQSFVAAHPQSAEVRMQLGRELAAERKISEAREQFREAEKAAP